MNAVALGSHGPVLLTGPPVRPDGEHAVLVRVELAGLCRSDLKELAGNRHGSSQFGHELVGEITRSTLAELPVGQRVCLDPNVPVRRGTGFATEMWVAGDARRLRSALPVVPRGPDARTLVFVEPLACAQHCLGAAARHLGRPLTGLRVGVLGAGTAGVLIAGLATLATATVLLGNRGADRTEFVRSRRVLDAQVGSLSWLPGDGLDLAVVATSFVLPDVLRHALRAVAPGGLVLLYGGTKPGDRLPGLDCDLDAVRRGEQAVAADWQGKPVLVGGSYGTSPEDFEPAVAASGVLPVRRMITRQIPLSALPGELRDQLTGRSLGKTLVLP